MIEDEKRSGLDPVVVFILISLLLHGLLFYFIPKLPKPEKKSEKPISVRLIEEPVKGEKKPPKKPHFLGKENITVKKETRPEDKPKVKGEKKIARRRIPPPHLMSKPVLKRPAIKLVQPPPKASYRPKSLTKKITPHEKKAARPGKEILAARKKERIKVAEARPKQINAPPISTKGKAPLKESATPLPKHKPKGRLAPGIAEIPPTKKSPHLPTPKSLFPSPETLHQIERKFSHTYPKDVEKGDTISLNTRSYKYISYFTHIKRKIELVWEYPRIAAELGQEGRLTLMFTILKNGRLAGVKLVHTSGYHLLDEEAIRAVKEAAPFHPIPDRLQKDHLNILANFTYTLGFKFVY